MKLAYLVIAHQHPEQLARLVAALDDGSAVFCIHIDAKSDAAPFVAALRGRAAVHFMPQRIRTTWAGFSLVAVALGLLAQARMLGFDYCVMLSGADYPIKPNAWLRSFFAATDKEYLTFWKLQDRPSWLHKIRYFYWIDAIPMREWALGIEPAYWRRLFWGRFFRYQRHLPRRRFLRGLVPYGGSDWWSLSAPCVDYILDYVGSHPDYVRFYRSTAAPSEMFIHTIVMNSRFASRVNGFDAYCAWSATRARDEEADTPMLPEEDFNLRYVDWSGQASGRREAPAILDDRDWDRLAASACHFARKFDPARSARLLDRIDTELLGLHPAAPAETASHEFAS